MGDVIDKVDFFNKLKKYNLLKGATNVDLMFVRKMVNERMLPSYTHEDVKLLRILISNR